MTAALTASASAPREGTLLTVTGSGFTALTAYVITVTSPKGGNGETTVTSDGAGAFTVTWPVTAHFGTYTFAARPKAEHSGTTTATATVTATPVP